jgi:glucose/arabinose dehydrogenase
MPARARSPRPLAAAILAFVLAGCGAGPDPSPSAADPAVPRSPSPVASPSPAVDASGSPSATPAPATPGAPPTLELEPVTAGLDAPLDVAVRPGDPSSVLVAEQGGRLRVVRDGTLLAGAFLDIADAVTAGGEQGLLGVVVHPDAADGRVFVYYTDRDERQVVSSFPTDPADPDQAVVGEEVRLLVMDDRFGNHNGGGLAFGPDGFLYIATGDGGGAGDPLDSGRDRTSLLAKILRIDVDGSAGDRPYGIPADNPFVDRDDAAPEAWLTGLRNPFRFRIDPATGLWIGDVGQGAREEIDLAPIGVGGLDFGWNVVEGTSCYADDPCDASGLTPPVAEYGHDEGCSVTGGAVYRGTAQPALTGWYVFADFCSGRMWVLPADERRFDAGPGEINVAHDSGRNLSAIVPGPDGELLATDLRSGELLRVVVAD